MRHGRESLGGVAHLRHAGRRRQIERHIFKIQLLLHAAVLLHHKGVVGGGNEKYVENTPLHEVLKGGILKV